MGPLPGIFAGGVLGIAGIVTDRAWMQQAGQMALLLNAFNLLPVLPLDGGQLMHAVLFSRHYLIDAAFRLVTALLLVCAGEWLGLGKALLYVGIGMAAGLPFSFKLARIAAGLKAAGMAAPAPVKVTPAAPAASPVEATFGMDMAMETLGSRGTSETDTPAAIEDTAYPVPLAYALRIIPKVRQAVPRKSSDKTIARYTLQVYELVSAQPPGWLGTLALTGLAGGAFLLALILAVVLVVAQRSDLKSLARLAAQAPRHSVSIASLHLKSGLTGTDPAAATKTLVATFRDGSAAEKAFAELGSQSERARIELFGETVLVEVLAGDDALRRRWFADLEGRKAKVFVNTGQTILPFAIQCVAPSPEVARQIREEAQEFLDCGGSELIPPWDPADSRSGPERARHRLARQTYSKLQKAGSTAYNSPEYKKLAKQIREATRQGDSTEADRLRQQRDRLFDSLRNHDIETLRAQGPDKVDLVVFERYVAYVAQAVAASRPANPDDEEPTDNGAYKRMRDDIGPRLGQVPMKGGKPVPGADRYCMSGGSVTREDQLGELSVPGAAQPDRRTRGHHPVAAGEGVQHREIRFPQLGQRRGTGVRTPGGGWHGTRLWQTIATPWPAYSRAQWRL